MRNTWNYKYSHHTDSKCKRRLLAGLDTQGLMRLMFAMTVSEMGNAAMQHINITQFLS